MAVERTGSARGKETSTEPSGGGRPPVELPLGVLWVAPEEHFQVLAGGDNIGRDPDCARRLTGANLSRRHARIEKDGPVWMIRDLDSKNGTFVNGEQRQLAPLSEQDVLRLGEWVGVVCRMPVEAGHGAALFHELPGGLLLSAATLQRLAHFSALAASDISIVLTGETGTGKEVLARALHEASGRRGALVAINCGAIPETMVEAELFGHEKGAFTGATHANAGRIAEAAGGTLFLDEIVELPARTQSKLLRVLEDRVVSALGGGRPKSIDFRLISATQEPLERLVRAGEFRADLYARVNGAEIAVPPLRERRQEVLRLLTHTLGKNADTPPEFESRAVEQLCLHAWPYNVRELVQLGRLLATAGKRRFALEDLPRRVGDQLAASVSTTPAEHAPARFSRRQLWLAGCAEELQRLKESVERCHGNVTEAARVSGIPRYRARRLLAADAARSKN